MNSVYDTGLPTPMYQEDRYGSNGYGYNSNSAPAPAYVEPSVTRKATNGYTYTNSVGNPMGRKLQFEGTWQPGTNVNSWDTGGKSEFVSTRISVLGVLCFMWLRCYLSQEATQQLVAMQAEVNHLKEQLVTQMENATRERLEATRERLEATRERREILESFKELAALVSTAGKNQPTSTGQSETNQNANATKNEKSTLNSHRIRPAC